MVSVQKSCDWLITDVDFIELYHKQVFPAPYSKSRAIFHKNRGGATIARVSDRRTPKNINLSKQFADVNMKEVHNETERENEMLWEQVACVQSPPPPPPPSHRKNKNRRRDFFSDGGGRLYTG